MTFFLPLFFISLIFIFPQLVSAHAFGTLYNLPVPFWLYLYGAGATLLVSFLIIGYFVNSSGQDLDSKKSLPKLNLLLADWCKDLLKAISVFLFLLTIITGLLGTNNSLLNFNMTFFWIIFLLGLTYLTALLGNIYFLLNPWKIIVEWLENILGEIKGAYKYPKNFSFYPALIFYFLFIWSELFGSITPFKLSIIVIQYSVITFLGVILFGKIWFQCGEFFGVFFNLLAKISPLIIVDNKIYLRPPFLGLVKDRAEDFSLVIFIIFMLASTAYDGFHSTIVWMKLVLSFSDSFYRLIQEAGLILAPMLFLVIFLLLIWLMRVFVKTNFTLKELALKFSFSLVPIALAYNLAHYYTLLITQGQEIIKLISDPFNFGWNLFGTASYKSNLAIVNAGFVWHSQVAVILLGHIAAVYLAHRISLEIFSNHKQAVISQLPMLILMIIYTMTGLWILSQPIGGG